MIVGFRELAARRLAIWASDGLVLRALVGRELKKRELLLTATGQRTHLILSIYPPALLCRRAFFTPRLCAFPGRELRMPAEVAAMRPAVAGTRGMNVNWEEKIVAPARDRQGEALRKMACGLVLTFPVVGSGTSAQAGPWCAFYDSSTYNCGFHSYAQCYATIYGNGGWCRPNIFEPSGRDRRSSKTRPPARY